MPDWHPITAAQQDGKTYLVWDGEVFGYPIAAWWRYDEVRQPTYKTQPERLWPVVACKNGRWEPIEEPLVHIVWSAGGLLPTHWLEWEPAPTPATMAAWDVETEAERVSA